MKKKYFHLMFFTKTFILLATFNTSLFAKNIDSTEDIYSSEQLHSVALNYLKQKTAQQFKNRKILINPISNNLSLPKCKQDIYLEDKSPNKISGRTTIKLSCSQPSWKLYVTANIKGDLPVVIATHGIIKQTVIKLKDIKLTYLPYNLIKRGAMKDLNSVVGMRSKKSINPNAIITINLLQPPYLVFKNQPITIMSRIGNLKVTAKGTALNNGTKEQQISFRNNKTKKILKGIVIAPNTVWVP